MQAEAAWENFHLSSNFLLILSEVNILSEYFRVFNDVGGKKMRPYVRLMSDEGNEKRAALKLCKYFSESFEILKLAKHSQFWNLFIYPMLEMLEIVAL